MLTLSKGYVKPVAGDKGNIFCPGISNNWQLVNDHNHDGITSLLISTSSISKPTKATAAVADWGASIGNALYRQTISTPTGLNYDDLRIECRIATGSAGAGNVVHPSIEKVTANTFNITTNDNTIGIDILYV